MELRIFLEVRNFIGRNGVDKVEIASVIRSIDRNVAAESMSSIFSRETLSAFQ
jgi:hypothetical protein